MDKTLLIVFLNKKIIFVHKIFLNENLKGKYKNA